MGKRESLEQSLHIFWVVIQQCTALLSLLKVASLLQEFAVYVKINSADDKKCNDSLYI